MAKNVSVKSLKTNCGIQMIKLNDGVQIESCEVIQNTKNNKTLLAKTYPATAKIIK